MFQDKVLITIKSGKGGDGAVSFRREKYVANGGPDGGDGGKGGDVIFMVDKGINNLSKFRYKKKYAAGTGEAGKKRRCHGKNGEDLILNVPEGTLVREAKEGKIIADLSGDNQRVVVIAGGKGGLGNQHFATSTMQAPKYAQPGQEAIEIDVILELKIIADVGLCGFPNAGKSTLLSRLSNAKPEIADYPFTTLNPILGVCDVSDEAGFVVADIPGLIEGAADGVGLGHDFLRHIERTKLLLHIVDAASTEGRDPKEAIKAINKELKSYSEDLGKKPQILVLNKADAIDKSEAEELLKELSTSFKCDACLISAVTGQGLDELKHKVLKALQELPDEPIVFEPEYVVTTEETNEDGYTIEKAGDTFIVEGPKIEKMLGYTNLETEKGFLFFQKFIMEQGIYDKLIDLGIEEGQTVQMYGHAFEFYK